MNIDKFVNERNAALLSMDKTKIMRFAKNYGLKIPTDDETFWKGVHKAICNVTSFPWDVRQKSAYWLLEHGSTPEIF